MKRFQISRNKTAATNDNLSVAPSPLGTRELNFPSYLRVYGIFAQHFLGKLRWRPPRNDLGAARRFSRAQTSVAIV
jgi:hypothetical protein